MTLKNEIFEGLASAKAGRDLVDDPQREYYRQGAERIALEVAVLGHTRRHLRVGELYEERPTATEQDRPLGVDPTDDRVSSEAAGHGSTVRGRVATAVGTLIGNGDATRAPGLWSLGTAAPG